MKRKDFEYKGKNVKVKQGVGKSSFGEDMSGEDFEIEDWWENISGVSWMDSNGNPAALEYAIRSAVYGKNNNVPAFSNDVVYGKINGFGHIFHINELELAV